MKLHSVQKNQDFLWNTKYHSSGRPEVVFDVDFLWNTKFSSGRPQTQIVFDKIASLADDLSEKEEGKIINMEESLIDSTQEEISIEVNKVEAEH